MVVKPKKNRWNKSKEDRPEKKGNESELLHPLQCIFPILPSRSHNAPSKYFQRRWQAIKQNQSF